MELIFSNIEEDDLVICSGLYVSTFQEQPWNEEWDIEDAFNRLNDFLSSPNYVAIKAVHKTEIYGFIFGEIQQWNNATYFYLKEICVNSVEQRKGIGKSLMNKLEEILQEKGVSRLYLITQRGGVASDFYSALGFSENESIMIVGKSIDKAN